MASKKILQLCKVINNKKIIEGFYNLELFSPEIANNSSPGQFINIKCTNEKLLLRRPFGISDVNIKKNIFSVLVKVIGCGTKSLSVVKEADELDILGPLGKGFNYDNNISNQLIYLISGGTGIAPFPYLIKSLKRYTNKIVLFSGFKNKFEYLGNKFFEELKIKNIVSTDDGSYGEKGFISDVLLTVMKNERIPNVIYACGPIPMLKAISKIAKKYGIKCEISLEEKMACGFGVCMGCTIKTKKGNKLVCKDGPVFRAEEIF